MYNLGDIKNLDSLYTLDPGAVTDALRWKEGAFQQNQQDLRKTELANLFDEQRNPYLVEQARLTNEQLGAQLPGMMADSAIKQRSNDMGAATYPDALKAARAKFMSEASDAHIKDLTNRFQEMAFSGETPEIKQKGIEGLRFTKDMVAERERIKLSGDKQIAGIRAQGEEARKTQQQAIDAGKFKHAVRGQQDALEKALASGSFDKASVAYARKAELLAEQGAPQDEIDYALQRSKYYADLWYNRPAQAREGSVDISGTTQGQVPTKQLQVPQAPPVVSRGTGRFPDNRQQVAQDIQEGAQYSSPEVEAQVRQYAGQSTSQPAPQMSVQKLQQMYPGVPVDKLKKAYKDKFGVDIN